jgi:hypothetical protein
MKTRLTSVAFAVIATLLFLTSLTTRANAQMSDTEKKAAARAAYQEGVKLQDEGKPAEALPRFESAQKLYDAPTHLLHIAECQALTGRLVEASETYELLARKTLPPGSPEAFSQAQQQGQAELPALRARIPTLRVNVKPGPAQVQNLQVNVNGVIMPNELIGIARPLNPGTYRFSAQAVGWSTQAPKDVPLGEKEQKSVDLELVQSAGAPVGAVVVAPPPPAPYGGNPDKPPVKAPQSGPTSSGLLLGLHAGAVIPAGNVTKGIKTEDFATTGGGGGIDIAVRLARMLLLGGVFEYASLGAPKTSSNIPTGVTADTSVSTTYVGINIGIIPNVDKVSFMGDIGLGSRAATLKQTQNGQTAETSVKGLEFALGLGVSIPAGPIRIVPKTTIGIGSFSSGDVTSPTGIKSSGTIDSTNRETHTFIMIGVAAFYSLDFGQKPGAAAESKAPSTAVRF